MTEATTTNSTNIAPLYNKCDPSEKMIKCIKLELPVNRLWIDKRLIFEK